MKSRTTEQNPSLFVSTRPIDLTGDTAHFDQQVRAEALRQARTHTSHSFPVIGESRYSHTRLFDRNRYSVRSFVPEDEGSGTWDLFRFSENLVVFVADCRYRQPKWLGVPNEGYFKIRLLRSGILRRPDGRVLLSGPAAMLALYPPQTGDGYTIEPGVDCQFVVLHCAEALLTRDLGIDLPAAPVPLKLLAEDQLSEPYHQVLDLTPRLVNGISDILDARDNYRAHMREWFVEAKAKEILSSVLQDLLRKPELAVGANRISHRDQHRITEAQDIIRSSLHDLPTIPALARMVGINQTKLKAGFKRVIGCTIGEFTRQQQMQIAARLLKTTRLPIAQISQAVGYRHQANFSQAFKRYYGRLPRSMRRNAPHPGVTAQA